MLDSGVLLASLEKEQELSPLDVEGALPACPLDEAVVVEEEEEEGGESLNLDSFIVGELEKLVSKLGEASSAQYRLSSSNRVLCDPSECPEGVYPEVVMCEDVALYCGGGGGKDLDHVPAHR